MPGRRDTFGVSAVPIGSERVPVLTVERQPLTHAALAALAMLLAILAAFAFNEAALHRSLGSATAVRSEGSRPSTLGTASVWRRLRGLPVAAQSVISTTLGADQARFAAQRAASGYRLQGGGVTANLGRGGVALGGAGAAAALTLRAAGRVGVLHRVGAALPTAHGNRVVYRHHDISEWYAAGPLGLEQGFTVRHRVSGSAGSFVLAIAVGGPLTPRGSGAGAVFITRSGQTALRYGGVQAVDARGRRLAATLSVQDGMLRIRVADRGARYPMTIDPFIQRGDKLIGSDSSFNGTSFDPSFGASLAVSSDGSTVLIGGPADGPAGAAWVFTQTGGIWSQQGNKLLPSTPSGRSAFGSSVALSADGDAAVIGGWFDGTDEAGAAWIFLRDAGGLIPWTKISPPSDAVVVPNDHGAFFGRSVAMSGDGHTVLIGGWGDSNYAGAAWVYSDAAGPWAEVKKLTPSDGNGPEFGSSVALSGDGSTALIAGMGDSGAAGAAWVFTNSGGGWAQQGQKLTPSDEVVFGGGSFGSSVALSQNGNTALIGGSSDDGRAGAAWAFTRSGVAWSQQGPKLTPNDEVDALGGGEFGSSVALSADGSTALIGAPQDFNAAGAAWAFVRSRGSWAQRGDKLAVNSIAGAEQGQGLFGAGVGLSGDGITALVAGPGDSSSYGAVWAFTQTPACANLTATTPPGGGTVSVALSCIGPEGQPFTYAIATGPAHGGVGSINQTSGAVTYVSQPGYVGTDSFTYLATDAGGASQPATVAITVLPAPPTCGDTAASTAPGGSPVSVSLSCAGPAGVGIQYGIVAPPAHGTLSALNQSAHSVIYTPSSGFHGVETVRYDASDSGGASNVATATITVPPGPPVCANIASSTSGESSRLTVLLSCSGPAGVGLTYSIVSRPAHGNLGTINQARRSVLYTARPGYHGTDRFIYRATDPGGPSRPASATITIPKPRGTLAFALLGWNFDASGTYSRVLSMTASSVPVGATIRASCHGHGCRLPGRPVTVTNSTHCKRKRHRCTTKTRPQTRGVDLTPLLSHTHFPVGSHLTISLTKRAFIGKVYLFTMRAGRQPAWRSACLAPGSTIPGRGC